MNETELIIKETLEVLKEHNLLKGNGIANLALYFNISRVAIYNMIKNDRITIKFYKLLKTDDYVKHIYISESYIINKMLMGY